MRLAWMLMYEQRIKNVSFICRHFGIPRKRLSRLSLNAKDRFKNKKTLKATKKSNLHPFDLKCK